MIAHQYLPDTASADDDILQYLNLSDESVIKAVSKIFEMEVPLHEPSLFPIWHRLFTNQQEPISILHFIESLAIYNYTELYENQHFISMQQVYLAVGMLTLDKSGVNIYEIGRNKSFTNDLGMD